MEQKSRPLTGKMEKAAALVAEDLLTDEQIAAAVGIGRTTLHKWKTTDEGFRARVGDIRTEIAEAVMSHGIARKENRIRAKNKRWLAFQQIAADREGKEITDRMGNPVPGGRTGWLHTETFVVAGRLTTQHVPDERLNNMLSKLEMDAAKEMGQLTEKVEHSGDVTVRRYVGIDPEDV